MRFVIYVRTYVIIGLPGFCNIVRPNITGIMSSVNGSEGPAVFHEGTLSLPEFTPLLELTCEAYGTPSPEVTWLRNGIALQNIPGRRAITFEDGGPFGELGNLTQSTLILSEVQLSDAGEYTCRATSGNVSPIPGTTAWIFTFTVTGELLMCVLQYVCGLLISFGLGEMQSQSRLFEEGTSDSLIKNTWSTQQLQCQMYAHFCVYFLPELDECNPDPCQNNGKCMDGVRNYTCNCPSIILDEVEIHYTGRNCEIGEKGIEIIFTINAHYITVT